MLIFVFKNLNYKKINECEIFNIKAHYAYKKQAKDPNIRCSTLSITMRKKHKHHLPNENDSQ